MCISNAQILGRKPPNHTTKTALDFRKSFISDLIEGKSFRRDTQMWLPPTSEIRFNQEHFHHLVSNDKRSTCKVQLQSVDTFYNFFRYIMTEEISYWVHFLGLSLLNKDHN